MKNLPLSALIDPVTDSRHLSQSVVTSLRQRISDGRLQPGDRLPPTRQLAAETGLSRSTIVTAYEQLVAEGYAEGRQGSGVYIRDFGDVEHSSPAPYMAQPVARDIKRAPPFLPGLADERLFPAQKWAKAVVQATRQDAMALVYEADPFGNWSLRDQICRYLAEWRGIVAQPEQVMMTAGSAEALNILLDVLMQAGDVIALENPGYSWFHGMATSRQLQPVYMQMDKDGSVPPSRDASLAFLTPSSQFPLGGAMPVGRRQQFLQWAAHQQGYIIEDDYDSELRYGGRPFPALASLPGAERVLYAGSFTKTFSANIRLGYAVLPPALVSRFQDRMTRRPGHVSSMAQLPLARFMENGEYYRHIRRIRRIYHERRQSLIGLLNTLPGGLVRFTDHRAGMHLTIEFDARLPDQDIEKRCQAAGLGVVALSRYCPAKPMRNGLLLGFTSHTEDEIRESWQQFKDIILGRKLIKWCVQDAARKGSG